MLRSLNKKYPFNDNLRINVRSIIGISLGIFLFLLFFQPLIPQNPDFNNKLLILAGFGAITLVLLGLIRIVFPSIFTRFFHTENWTLKKEILIDLIFLILNSVAFAFFAKFVGKIPVSFHIAIVIVIISVASVTILLVINEMRFLKNQVHKEKSKDKEVVSEEDEKSEEIEIEFESENKTEYFHVRLSNIILIKSANNYIEVFYQTGEKISHRLIRNTMKNTEELLSRHPAMIRCHRSCMVNKKFIKKVNKGSEGMILQLDNYPDDIHVSRQYKLKVREALEPNK